MLLQPDKSYFNIEMIKEVEAYEVRSRWTHKKKIEVNNKHKNKDGDIKTVLSIWYFRRNRFLDGRLMNHKSRLFTHGGIQ